MGWLVISAILSILAGSGLLLHYYNEKKKQKEQKGFIIIGTALLLFTLFPGAGLFILGVIILIASLL